LNARLVFDSTLRPWKVQTQVSRSSGIPVSDAQMASVDIKVQVW
jgi:hypothetical protein